MTELYNFIPTKYEGKRCLINDFILVDAIEKNDNIFNLTMPDIIQNKINLLSKNHKYGEYLVYKRKQKHRHEISAADEKENKYLYIYTEIYCESDHEIILGMLSSYESKVWLNNNLITIFTSDGGRSVACKLKRGCNVLVAEMRNKDKNNYNWGTFIYQIMNYKEEKSDYIISCKQIWKHMKIDEVSIIHEDTNCIEKNDFKFLVIPNNQLVVKPDDYFTVIDANKGNLINKFQYFKLNNIDLTDYKKSLELDMAMLGLIIQDNPVPISITLKDLKPLFQKALNELKIINQNQIRLCNNIIFKNHINYHIENLDNLIISNSSQDHCRDYYSLYDLNKKLKSDLNDAINSYYKEGVKLLSYRSELDNKITHILYRLPKNYDKNKEYPVFFSFAALQYSWTSFAVENTADFIWVDISLRGLLLGSYMGEASAIEAMNFCKSIFKIDKNKIYTMGYSSGASAVWTYLQNHPGEVAGAYVIGGAPQDYNIENVSNITIYNTVSDDDNYYDKNVNLENNLDLNENYHQINCSGYIHDHFCTHTTETSIIDLLLNIELNKYPNSIKFKSQRACHLKSYYYEISGIQYGKKFVSLYSVIDNNKIIIKIQNAVGFTITIPPQINKNDFTIIINDKNFYFKNYRETTISFKNDGAYKVGDKFETHCCKGTGILDVYLKKLKIVVPDDADEIEYNSARQYAVPKCSGFIPDIFVDYPIIKESEFNEELLSYNLIIFGRDNFFKNHLLNVISKKTYIKTNINNFTYANTEYSGDYCVEHIIKNPYSLNNSILFINYNKHEILNQNLFIRKVIIPSYSNNTHKFWNNEALIYYDKQYYTIYEWGMDISKVEM